MSAGDHQSLLQSIEDDAELAQDIASDQNIKAGPGHLLDHGNADNVGR